MAHVQHSNCTTGEIRLTDGTTQYEGRVEVCINGVWGAICDSGWDTREAYAVCHQLGYQGNNFKDVIAINMYIMYMHYRWSIFCKFSLWYWLLSYCCLSFVLFILSK